MCLDFQALCPLRRHRHCGRLFGAPSVFAAAAQTQLQCSPVQALQVVDNTLQDYFTKKKSRLSAAFLKALLKEHPSRQAAEALMGFYSNARNAFLKAEAVQLLQTLMHPVKVRAG